MGFVLIAIGSIIEIIIISLFNEHLKKGGRGIRLFQDFLPFIPGLAMIIIGCLLV